MCGGVVGVTEVRSFEQFFRDEYPPLVALGTWLTGDRSMGEDLAQDALGQTHRRWADVSAYERPGGFARRALINLASNERRRLGREQRALRRMSVLPSTGNGGGHVEADEELWAEVAALPLQQRAAVGLRYLEDLPSAAIADALGCSEATVRVHLHRAHRRLAERLPTPPGAPDPDSEGCPP